MPGFEIQHGIKVLIKMHRPAFCYSASEYGYMSCSIHDSFNATNTCVYRRDQWTRPQLDCGPLCVFENVKAADMLMWEYLEGRSVFIAHCDYEPSRRQEVWMRERRWDSQLTTRFKGLGDLPEGTRLAARVMLMSVPCAPVYFDSKRNN